MQMTQRIVFHITLLLMTFSLPGCREREHDARLMAVYDMTTDSPEAAIDSLGKVDYALLDERDRHFYDFLSVKAADKAYIKHERDSLILDVVGYYSSHRGAALYPEALYYAGRVYSDLGDYPTALRYYQDALDELDDEDVNLDLKANMLSQTGRLLSILRLYDEAIPYMSESIEISKLLKDTFNIAYDYQQLAHLYTNMENYEFARKNNEEATRWASYLKESDQADMRTNLAYILHREGKNDSALIVIRNLLSIVDSVSLNYTKAIATRIFLDAGVIDTAYMYAYELVASQDPVHGKAGFEILFSPELKTIVPIDTLRKYSSSYAQFMENYLNSRDSQQVIIQNSNYNYQKHVRMREKAEQEKETMLYILLTVFCILVAVIILALCLYLRYMKQKEKLQETLSKIQSLAGGNVLPDSNESVEELRSKISATLSKIGKTSPPVANGILDSRVYCTLRKSIDANRAIHKDDLEKIKSLITKVSPRFIHKLNQLANGDLTERDLEVALLIRMGFTVTETGKLLCLTKSAVSTRRKKIIEKFFGDEVGIEYLDTIIRLL